jgi:hypothetical protein
MLLLRKIKLVFFVLCLFIVHGCNKNNRHPVPYYQFDLTINFNLPSYSTLLGVGGWAYVSGIGSKGIIIYRSSANSFVAFDRHSPADPEGNCLPLYPDANNFFILIDECNNARFSLLDGSPWNDSQYTEWGLRSYQTYFDGDVKLRILNP